MKVNMLLAVVGFAICTTSVAFGQSDKKPAVESAVESAIERPVEPGSSDRATQTEQAEATELAVGVAAPDFELVTLGDETVTLSERFGAEGKPVILLFSRASW